MADMRKTLIVITMGLMLTQTMTAQVFDDEKYLQWRSMETGRGMDCFIVDSI